MNDKISSIAERMAKTSIEQVSNYTHSLSGHFGMWVKVENIRAQRAILTKKLYRILMEEITAFNKSHRAKK